MGSMEPGSAENLHEKRLEAPPATENKPPDEQKQAEERGQAPKKSRGPAWRRAVVPTLYIAGTGVLLYAAWRWLRPKDASKKSKSTWTLDDTLGPYD
ncbi:MAG TPA: hypothetical protein VMG30_21570 [Acidobacteriota bacterium]|nr:hypothetical protein [Acidobacteriota bacterium]